VEKDGPDQFASHLSAPRQAVVETWFTLKANVDGRMVMGMTADGEAGAFAGVVQAVHASSDADEGRTKQREIWGRCQT